MDTEHILAVEDDHVCMNGGIKETLIRLLKTEAEELIKDLRSRNDTFKLCMSERLRGAPGGGAGQVRQNFANAARECSVIARTSSSRVDPEVERAAEGLSEYYKSIMNILEKVEPCK